MDIIKPPQHVPLPSLSASAPAGSTVSAYKGVVTFTTSRDSRGQRLRTASGTTGSVTDSAVAGASIDGEIRTTGVTSKLTCHYLMVRLEKQETDLLVFFNVPHGEFDQSGDARGLSKEENVAEETIDALVHDLEIKDWALFV